MRTAAVALIAVGVTLGGTGVAVTAPWTATELRDACSNDELYYIYGACAGYVLGVHDRHLAEFGGVPALCVPEGTTIFEINAALDRVLPDLEAIAEESGTGLALRALAMAYPCD